ncbi:MAG: FAD-dependent oxidoreductase [Actinomycetia bacterium]|nr:FAD-dependent oxidoreductase [Actinomycetes bacterium]MCP5030498.1 FAD-dependent oxidoreductase [Actinomycetes bacterium]
MSNTEPTGSVPESANAVIIGAGIVGSCLAGHLAELGWTDIILLDKGPLPNPGGSTGHASNFIFPVDHNKEMAFLTLESQRQYEALGLNTTCGGIEVARTEERMEELRRRMTSAKTWGIEAEMLTPEQIKEKVPFINPDILLGGFYTASASVVDSLETGTMMRARAQDNGLLQTFANTEVTDLEVTDGLVSAVVTDKGTIRCQTVAVACGVWSPRIAEMAGATIPLTPAVHQMADVGPIDILQATGNEIGYPIVRDMDTFCYERQSSGSMEVGSYAHRPIFHRPDEIPSNEEAALSPTEMPFTDDDFDPQMEQALELMGDILDDAEIRYAINGLLSLTPDAMPVLGQTEVENLWSAAAVWVKEGPGIAQLVAEWMTHGYPHLCDPEGSDIARLYPHERSVEHIEARCAEHFNKTYGIVHPREQWDSERGQFKSPFYSREEALGAVFYDARGWERPQYYETNAPLVETYGLSERPAEWDNRWWSPIQEAEHLAMRAGVGMVDLSAFQIFDLEGPGALDAIQYLTVNQCDVAIGRSVYTPFLTPGGGFHSDLTVMRLGGDHFRVVTGAFDGGRDEQWIKRYLPDPAAVTFTNRTTDICTIGVWGPNAAALVGSLTDADLSQDGFPYGTTADLTIAGVPAKAFRISYVGDAGWEIYVDWSDGPALWDALWEAGQDHRVVPVGIGVYGTSGRIEKGYRLMGAELESEYTPIEAGLARPKVKAADFIGKAAYLEARAEDPAAVLCTLTISDHHDRSGRPRYPTGGNEPILTLDGERIVDRKGRVSRVTTAGRAPSLGEYLLMAYLPPEHAVEGTLLQVMYMNELFPVAVARVGSKPLFDPDDSRMKS